MLAFLKKFLLAGSIIAMGAHACAMQASKKS